MSKWIEFLPIVAPRRKTSTWELVAKESGSHLGWIKWYSPWRKYSFFPGVETLYEPICLRDIANFIDEQMVARKKTS